MKRCELCKSAAAIFCESDQASLCWGCDAKVHSANFLVARHSRTLLCHVCQSPTAWNASGSRLGKTVSVCESCAAGFKRAEESRGREEEEEETEGGNGDEIDVEDGDYEDEEDQEVEEEEEGENQVVPLSSTPPPPATSSSSGEKTSRSFCNGDGAVSLKRLRENTADLHSEDDLGCSSSHRKNCSLPPAPPSKRGKAETNQSATVQHRPACSRIAAIVESGESESS